MKNLPFPDFLTNVVSKAHYERWLDRKAVSHCRRDRRRGNLIALGEEYRWEIHRAVMMSNGRDFYTGEMLDWKLISRYRNDASRQGKRLYKKALALLPTVDHVGDGKGRANFVICSWRTNDAKSDLSCEEFEELCRKVLVVAEWRKQLRSSEA